MTRSRLWRHGWKPTLNWILLIAVFGSLLYEAVG
jgi:hypothetical protein